MKPNNLNTEQAKLNAQHASFPRDSCALGGSRSRRTAACVREMNATRRTLRPHSGGWYSEGERPPREQMQTQIRKFERCAHRKEALSPKTHLDSSVLLNLFFLCVCVFPPFLAFGQGRAESIAAHYCKSSAAGGERTSDGRRCLHAPPGGVFVNPAWSGDVAPVG